MRLEATRADVVAEVQAALALLAEPAGNQTLKAQTNRIAARTGWDPERIRKLRKGYVLPHVTEYRALMTLAEELRGRHANIREQHRRIAELIEPRRAEGNGGGADDSGRDTD